jgi:heme/copper-type cytochrome/quinol oxidase subunit 2
MVAGVLAAVMTLGPLPWLPLGPALLTIILGWVRTTFLHMVIVVVIVVMIVVMVVMVVVVVLLGECRERREAKRGAECQGDKLFHHGGCLQ